MGGRQTTSPGSDTVKLGGTGRLVFDYLHQDEVSCGDKNNRHYHRRDQHERQVPIYWVQCRSLKLDCFHIFVLSNKVRQSRKGISHIPPHSTKLVVSRVLLHSKPCYAI